jgi:serine/threonine protein kinase/WD40 repeat protein
MAGAEDLRDPVEQLAQSFLERYRRGERPDVSEYTQRHPELADDIRDLFPALVAMEEAGPRDSQPPGGRAVADGRVPERLGDYRIVREVGRGGMGIVYEAVQEALGRHVALKVLPFQAGADPVRLLRFRREARSLARLHHTNIVPVFDIGEYQRTHYYAMQFIQGQGLDEVLVELQRFEGPAAPPELAVANLTRSLAGSLVRGQFGDGSGPDAAPAVTRAGGDVAEVGPRPEPPLRAGVSTESAHGSHSELSTESGVHFHRSVARVGLQVAEALAYAHGQHVLHRDIKPSNLLLDVQGTVWVTDFGLAKEEGEDLTQTGDLVGTLRYMAPERFRGVSDARSDLYSLGLTLYELLTLRPAFQESDRGLLIKQIYHDEPPRPRRFDRQVPRDLETIVLKAIAKEPARRYQTAEDLAEDLRRFLADRPIRARRSAAWEHAWRWCRRNPALAAALGSAAVLLVVVAVGASLAAWRLGEAEKATRQQLHLTEQVQEDATRRLYRSLVLQARASRRSRGVGQRFESLKVLEQATQLARQMDLPAEDFLELRNEAIAALALPDARVVQEWDGWPDDSAPVDLDGSLERYARVDRGGNVTVARLAADAEPCQFVTGLEHARPRLSPDGRFLALSDPPRYELWQLDGPKAALLLQAADCTAHDFRPDGRRVATVHADGTIRLYDLPSGRLVRQLEPGPRPVRFAAFHPDGRRLAVAHGGGVQVRDLDTGSVLANLAQAGAHHLAWHPGGATLAAVGGDQVIHLWDVASRREVAGLRRWKNAGLRVTFNHAGDLLASFGWEQMVRVWEPRTGEELFHLPASFSGTSLRFGPDGRLAADIKDNKLRLWEVAPGHECRRLVRNPARGKAPYGPFAVSPNGLILAAAAPNGFGLWDSRTGERLASVPCGPLDDVVFETARTLLTAGPAGIFRWPLQPDAGSAGVLRLGPPQRLPLPGTSETQIACTPDGRAVASAHPGGALVLHADHPEQPVRLAPHEGARAVALSPDARWVATGSQDGTGARVWDARTRKLVKDLVPQEGRVRVCFSPDRRWLATRGNGLRLWAVGSWQEGPSLGGISGAAFAFSPAENLLATETGSGAVRLVDPDTGREYARLDDPDQVRVTWICFSPDGSRLLTAGGGDGAWIRVWDLRTIRAELARRGLDWDLPPYPPAADPPDAPPVRVAVDLGWLRGAAPAAAGRWQEAAAGDGSPEGKAPKKK